MDQSWTYYKFLGGQFFETVLGVFRRKRGGLAERWDVSSGEWVQISPSFLNDRLAEGAMDLDHITEVEARRLMGSAASLRPDLSLTAD